jgi:hypothetical protein
MVGWNSDGTGSEAEKTGHTLFWLEPPVPGYYWSASRDYVEAGAAGGVRGTSVVEGFPLFSQALANHGLTAAHVTIRHKPGSLGGDIQGTDWWWNPSEALETRLYQGGAVEIRLNGELMAGAADTTVTVEADYGQLSDPYDDSLAARCSAFVPADLSGPSSWVAKEAAKAFLADVGAYGIALSYGGYQPIGNGSFSGNGRSGGIFEVQYGSLTIGETPLGDTCCTTGCDIRQVDLGVPFGQVELKRVSPMSACFTGLVPVTEVAFPYSQMEVTACYQKADDPNSELTALTVEAVFDLGPWGVHPVSGDWLSGLRCLSNAPFSILTVLQFGEIVGTACINEAGESTFLLTGTVELQAGSDAIPFAGSVDTTSQPAVLHLGVGTVQFGSYFVHGTELRVAQGDGPVLSLTGALTVGPPNARLQLDLEGGYATQGPVRLFAPSPGGSWTPMAGIDFYGVQGVLERNDEGAWVLNLVMEGTLHAGPLGEIPLGVGVILPNPDEFLSCIPADTEAAAIEAILSGSYLLDIEGNVGMVLCFDNASGNLDADIDLFNWSPWSRLDVVVEKVTLVLERRVGEWVAKLRIGIPDPAEVDLGLLGIAEIQGESVIVDGLPDSCFEVRRFVVVGATLGGILGGPLGAVLGAALATGAAGVVCLREEGSLEFHLPDWAPDLGQGPSGSILLTIRQSASDWLPYVVVGGPGEPFSVHLGPLGTVELTGTLDLVSTPEGEQVLTGCLSGSLALEPDGPLAGLPGQVSGVPTVQLCYSAGVTVGTVTLPEWRPFTFMPDFSLHNVKGQLEQIPGDPGSLRLNFQEALSGLSQLCGRIAVWNPNLRAVLVGVNDWEVTFSGSITVDVGGTQYDAGFSKTIRRSDDPVLRLRAKCTGTVEHEAESAETESGMQRPSIRINQPDVDILCAVSPPSIEVSVTGTGVVSVGPFELTGELVGGGYFGETAGFWTQATMAASGDFGQPSRLVVPGIGKATGDLCVATLMGSVPGKMLCGREAPEGLSLSGEFHLPQVLPGQPAVSTGVIYIDGTEHYRMEMPLTGYEWQAVLPEDDFPSIRRLMFNDMVLFWKGGWTSFVSGIRSRVEFTPESEPQRILPGKAEFSLDTISHQNTLRFQLDGRWLSPLGLTDLAVENPRFEGPLFYPPGIGHVALGTRGRWYWKTGGDWPPEPTMPLGESPEICDDPMQDDEDGNGKANCGMVGVPGSADPACVNHLTCVSRNPDSPIVVLGGGFYVDTRRKASAWVNGRYLPIIVLDLDFSGMRVNLEEEEREKTLLRLTENGWAEGLAWIRKIPQAIRSVLTAHFSGLGGTVPVEALNAHFPDVDLAALCATPGVCPGGGLLLGDVLSLDTVQLAASTQAVRVFDTNYAPGLRASFQDLPDEDGQTVELVGHLEPSGMTLEGLILYPALPGVGGILPDFAVGPDPLRRTAQLNPVFAGAIEVPSDARLNLPSGTVEGWVQSHSWATKSYLPSLVSRFSGSGSSANGYSVTVGKPEDGWGRVTVTFRQAGKVRMVQSQQGQVPPGLRTHIAASWEAPSDSPVVQVRIFVNGIEVETEELKATVSPDHTIGPGASSGKLLVGQRMELVDDVRLWNVALSPAQIAAGMRFLPLGYHTDERLVARYEFDFDDPPEGAGTAVITVHNSRYHAVGSKLHGKIVGGGLSQETLSRPYVRLKLPNLLLPGAGSAELSIQGGTRVDWLLRSVWDAEMRFQVTVGGGSAEGFVHGRTPLTLLDAPGLGQISLTGRGPIPTADTTFEDGFYATVDFAAGTVSGSGYLQFLSDSLDLPVDLGSAHFSFDCPDQQVCQQVEKILTTVLEPPFDIPLPSWPILKDARISGEEMRIFNRAAGALSEAKAQFRGKLVSFGKELESELFEWLPDRITFLASVSAPMALIHHPVGYEASVLFTLLPPQRTLCGEVLELFLELGPPGSPNVLWAPCTIDEICLRPDGELVGQMVCDCGLACETFCRTDADCNPPGQVEQKRCEGFYCIGPLPDGGMCFGHPEWCASGHCAGISARCYTPGSVKSRHTCDLTAEDQPSHCVDGYVCVPSPDIFVHGGCEPMMYWGVTGCGWDEQCPPGTVCRGVGYRDRACLYPLLERKVGETCVAPTECESGVCLQGRCKCSPAYCASLPGSNYCADNGHCYPRLANGQDCCSPDQCLGGGCTKLVCTPPVFGKGGGSTGTMGRCFSPGSSGIGGSCALSPLQCSTGLCTGGICRCTASSQCGSNRWCNLNPLLGQVGECRSKIGNGQSCDPLMPWNCQSNRCGAYISSPLQPVCYALDSKGYDQECIAWDQCQSHRCEPRQCSWNSNPDATCGAFWVAARVAAGQWSQLAQCNCLTARCSCSGHGDCSSDRYCGSPEVFGVGVPAFRECRSDKGFGASCSGSEECQSGYCIQGTFTRNCGCSSNANCGTPRRCVNGVCKF